MYMVKGCHVQSLDDSQYSSKVDNWENHLDTFLDNGKSDDNTIVSDDDVIMDECDDSTKNETFTIIKKKIRNEYPLNTPWTLYYHDPENSKWTIDSYIKIQTIKTVFDIWNINNKLPSRSFHLGMFFLMRDDILPTWEDPRNRNGGCWSYKISILNVYDLWLNLTMYTVSENLSKKNEYITGISISPKKGFCIVKIWNSNSSYCENSQLTTQIDNLVHEQSLYTPFKDKK